MKTRHVSKLFLMGVVFLAIGLLANTAQAQWETLIPSDSMTPANFDTYWNWFYRWGDTHNGAAKMYVDQVTLDGSGMATIVAETPDPESGWKYRSGAFNSKQDFKCDECYPEWDFKGEFKAPTVTGSWPAFWYTGSDNWPPEIDILEFKGTVQNWFNTYDGSWETKKVRINDADTVWHEYRCHITQLNATDVEVQFYLDGALKGTHTGSNFVGEWMHVIVNMQMEGSSGTPGPTEPTYYYARDIVVQRYDAGPPTGPPAAPTNLGTTIGDTTVDLNWDANNSECDFSHYNVNRSTTQGGPYTQIATDLTETTHLDTGRTNGTTYYYVVTAADFDLNESSNSNEASATPVSMFSITIDNYSFEQPPGGKQTGVVPDYWSLDGAEHGIEGFGYDGVQCAFLGGNDDTFYQLTGYTIAQGEQIQLTYYGCRTWSNSGRTATFTGNLYYDDSGSRVTIASAPGSATTDGDWVMYTVSANITPGHDAIGKTLGVELVHTTAATDTWAGFDYVSMNSFVAGYCGDATCDPGEDQCNCAADCGTPPATETNCTDGIDEDCDGGADCNDPTGDCDSDPACLSACNNNGTCETGEDCNNCPNDCISKTNGNPSSHYCCGDGTCEGAEDSSNCAVDCGSGPVCGDGTCDPGEDNSNCPADCPPSSCNNNGICEPGEDCNNCSNDCDSVTGGNPNNRYCCGDGEQTGPEGDGRCDGNY